MISGYVSNKLIAQDTIQNFKSRFMQRDAQKLIDPTNPLSHTRVYVTTPNFAQLQIDHNILFNQHSAKMQQLLQLPPNIPELTAQFYNTNSQLKQYYKALTQTDEIKQDSPVQGLKMSQDQPLKQIQSLFKQNMYSMVTSVIQDSINDINDQQKIEKQRILQLQQQFMQNTGQGEDIAKFYLDACNNDLKQSIALFQMDHQ